jgi:hypothetical protein
MEKYEVKFKEGVYGFIYDSCYGQVNKVFTEPLTEKELKLVESVVGEYDCIFTDIKSVNEVFEFDEDSLSCDVEGLNKVLEYVE